MQFSLLNVHHGMLTYIVNKSGLTVQRFFVFVSFKKIHILFCGYMWQTNCFTVHVISLRIILYIMVSLNTYL